MAVVPKVRDGIGYTYAGAHAYYALDGDIVFQIAAKYPQHKEPRLARRRFVYYWETDFKKSAWVRHGLAMTDDDGFLFDLKSFFNDHVDNRNLPDNLSPITEWKIKKFDHEKRAWVEKRWDFFGGIEDTIAFQRWIGLPHLSSDTRENTEDAKYFKNTTRFVRLDENDQPVFRYHFLAPEKYLLKFRPGRKRLFMFCPPDIINPAQCKQKGQKQQPSLPVVQTSGSNRNIDFEFMPEPLEAWSTHKYYVKKDETMSDIVEKYNETLTRFHKKNEKLLGNNPNHIKEGWALEVPGSDMTNPFCTAADERLIFETIGKDETLRVSKFPIQRQGERTLHSARMLLATNLEEHLSNLAFHTCLLDMEYQQVVESSKPFIEASTKVRQMGDLLELMYTYPGYKKRVPCPGPGMSPGDFSTGGGELDNLRVTTEYNSVYYEGPIEMDAGKIKDVQESAEKYHQYADELAEAIWNDNNPVFATEKDDIYREVDIIEDIVTSPAFYRRLDEWVGYELYGKEKGDYPYLLKHSCNATGFGPKLNQQYAPVVYRVIQDAFCLMLSMDLAQRPGKSEEKDTVAEAFYKRAVAPFEADLELEYMKLDALHNVGAEIVKLCKLPDVAILKPDADKTVVENQYWLNVLYSKPQATVLQIVFEKALFKNIAQKMDTFYQAIAMLSARCRAAMILSETNTARAVQAAFSYLKIEIGKLILAGADKQSITLELEQGAKEFARIKAANARKAAAVEIGKKGTKAPAVPEKLKALTAGFGFAYLLYETALFAQKCNDEKKNTPKDWYDFAKVINNGGLWVAKFDPGWTRRIPVLRSIENKLTEKSKAFIGIKLKGLETYALKPLQASFMIIDSIISAREALNYYEDGEELLCGIRSVQSALCVIMLMGFAIGVPILSCPIGAALLAVGFLIFDVAKGVALLFRKGVENTVKDTRAQLNRMPLFKGEVTTFSEDSRYVLYNALTFVMERQTWHSLTPALKKWRTEIEPIDETISWWNLDVIRAGSALRAMGYSYEEIAYICMEIQEREGLRQVEREWIQYFADNETFSIRQRKEPLRKAQNGEITVEPKGIEEYNRAFVKWGDRLEIATLPPKKASAQGMFQ